MPIRSLAFLASILAACAAAKADPVFPGASGVGLEPPPGMQPAKTFNGFQAGKASIVISEMPKAAYEQIDGKRAMFVTRFAAKQADDVEVNGVRGFLIKGTQPSADQRFRKWILVLDGKDETALVSAQVPESDTALDAKVDAALKTVAFRARPGLEQQVAALPFTVGDLAGFRASAVTMGVALILVDGPKDQDQAESQAHVIAAVNAGAVPKDGRAEFAKTQLQSFQAVRTTEIQSAKTFDADGAQWAVVTAKGSEGQAESPVQLTYYVRFGETNYLTVVCVAPADKAAQDDERFRKLALSIKPK